MKIVDEAYYENDDIMASLGRAMVDQYIGFANRFGIPKEMAGWPGYAELTLLNSEVIIDDEDDEVTT